VTEGTPSGSIEPGPELVPEPRLTEPRLAVLKALGDNTRYAIYLELARSPRPLATAEIAESLDLHPNTVRPHLERMRDVGLLDVEADARGAVGRPQHRYSIAADAPSLGLEPATFPVLARMLLRVAASGGLGRDEVVDAGREQGVADAGALARALGLPPGSAADPGTCVGGLMARLDALGFDPELAGDDAQVTVGFAHCPFRELAEANPEIVCALHQGLVEGIVRRLGGAEVDEFHPLTDRAPCQVDLALISP
jgi:predicted ArsR family transcriptional regulator